jgi:hypothetical protein
MFVRLAAAIGFAALAVSAQAGEAGDLLTKHLYGGDLTGGIAALTPLAEAGDNEARFGIGFIHFTQGVEGLVQSLYRHGLSAPDAGPMGPLMLVPVPANPSPEPLTYDGVRLIFQALVDQMEAASATLEAAGTAGDWVVPIDLMAIRIDADANGTAEEGETIGLVLGRAFGPSGSVLGGGEAPPPVAIGFDRADAIWLAGYSQVFAAQADFFLAHDFGDFVNAAFHRLFPKAGLPMQDYAEGGMLVLDPQTDTAIADVIAAIHTINWPVIEPERLKRVHARFGDIIRLSRLNWEAILAETDDNAELVPNPKQTSLVPDGVVTDEIVAAWFATLETADQVLAGDLLVPHWRFKQGFDLKAYFDTATRTDFVMLLTGYDAVPFIKDGPIASAESFAAANAVFGDNLLGYVFWFN